MDPEMKVVCADPYSAEFIEFPVILGSRFSKQLYTLDAFTEKHITRHNAKERAILLHMNYDLSLEEWLKDPQGWSTVHRDWGLDRPCEEACLLIEAILKAVGNFHYSGKIHGGLKHPENYLIQYDIEKNVKVLLIHDKMDYDTFRMGKKDDIVDMSYIIFDQVLKGVAVENYPEDLKRLRNSINNCHGSDDWLSIIRHPSLWNYRKRIAFIVRVRMLLLNESDVAAVISDEIEYMDEDFADWQSKIPYGTPYEDFLYSNGKGIYFDKPVYGTSTAELLRYVRNFMIHFKKSLDHPNPASDQPPPIYQNEEYNELMFSKFFEGLIVLLFEMVFSLEKNEILSKGECDMF